MKILGPKEKYDFIFSLGCDCACSGFLRNNRLQRGSFPFDWLTKAPLQNRIDLICNDFMGFLNKEDFRFLPKTTGKDFDDKCDYYENIKTSFYFFHDFHIGMPFDEAFAVVKEKYERRIGRFYQRMNDADKILCVWFVKDKESSEELKNGLARIQAKFAGKEIHFLVIENDESLLLNEVKEENITPLIKRYSYNMFCPDSSAKITAVMGNKRIGNKIFSKYALNLPLSVRLKDFIQKTAIAFIPIKKVRRRFRKRYEY